MTDRDPRVDPRPGDVLRAQTRMLQTVTRRVLMATVGHVTYASTREGRKKETLATVAAATWRRWAKGAEVVNG